MLLDTFGRTPNEINNYIKELYNTPQIFFTQEYGKFNLHIKYPYSEQIFCFQIEIYKNNDGVQCVNFDRLNEFIDDLKNKRPSYYEYNFNSYQNFSIRVNHSIIIKQLLYTTHLHINHLDQIIEAFTKYKDMLTIMIFKIK
jgi:hypothetical protein